MILVGIQWHQFFHLIPNFQAKQGHTHYNSKGLSFILCCVIHGWQGDIRVLSSSPSIEFLSVVGFSLPHIHWESILLHAPSLAFEAEPPAGSLVSTVDCHKIKTWLLKCKGYKFIMDKGKEELHFAKYDNLGRCFMASTLCAVSW